MFPETFCGKILKINIFKKYINKCENRAPDVVFGTNEFKYDSGASEKLYMFVMRLSFFQFLDRLLDTRDDAKT